MWWIIGLVGVGVVLVGFGAWMLAPSLRSLFGHDFEPAPKDSASVDNAIMTRMVDGGGS